MPAKRNPLLTVKGTRYTYAGWVRAYNAALKNGGSNLAYRLSEAYPNHYTKHMEQARAKDLGGRQHAAAPGVPPAARKPATRKPAPTTSRTQKRVSDIQMVDMADYRAGERAAEKWSRTKSPREIRRKIDDRLIRLAEDGTGDHSPQYWQGYLSALHDDARTKRARRESVNS